MDYRDLRGTLALAACLIPAFAGAISKSATIGFNALVLPACVAGGVNLSTPGQFDPLSFGTHYSLSATVTTLGGAGSGGVRVNCVANVPYKVLIAGGSSGNPSARRMVGPGAATIAYNLYTSSTYATVWDNVTGVSGTGNGADQWLPVYGRVPAQSTPAPGAYVDTLTVTVVW